MRCGHYDGCPKTQPRKGLIASRLSLLCQQIYLIFSLCQCTVEVFVFYSKDCETTIYSLIGLRVEAFLRELLAAFWIYWGNPIIQTLSTMLFQFPVTWRQIQCRTLLPSPQSRTESIRQRAQVTRNFKQLAYVCWHRVQLAHPGLQAIAVKTVSSSWTSSPAAYSATFVHRHALMQTDG